MVATSDSLSLITWSSTLVITSPCSRPASSAAEPGETSPMPAPVSSPSLLLASTTDTPRRAWVGVSPLRSWSTIGSTLSIGIAKPRPIEPASPATLLETERMEELMPTTSPRMFTSGPPELPGLIAASVCTAG